MTTIFQRAIVMAALSLTAAAQSGNGSHPKKTYRRSAVAVNQRRSSIPVPKPQSTGPSADQQLSQIEQQTLHSSGPTSANSIARRAAAPRVPVAANTKNRNINFKYQAPKQNSTPGQVH